MPEARVEFDGRPMRIYTTEVDEYHDVDEIIIEEGAAWCYTVREAEPGDPKSRTTERYLKMPAGQGLTTVVLTLVAVIGPGHWREIRPL
jgi:hypothetical protein